MKLEEMKPIAMSMIIADFVYIDHTGKVYVLGMFDTIHIPKFPFSWPRITIYQKFSDIPYSEQEYANLYIQYLDGNFERLASLKVYLKKQSDRLTPMAFTTIIDNLVIPRAGLLEFGFEINHVQVNRGEIKIIDSGVKHATTTDVGKS